MQIFRRVCQLLFLFFFLFTFLLATYPLTSKIAVDFFLRLDPLMAISTSIAERSFYYKIIPSAVLLLLTVIFGRFFCGWVCPLGTTIDGSDRTFGIKSKNKQKGSSGWIKFFLLTVIIFASILSVQLAGYVDPIPLLTRTMVTFIYPLFVLFTDGLFGFLMSIPFLEDIIFNIQELLRGTILPIYITTYRSMFLIAVLFITILGLSLINRRFWCRNICPLGALLGLFSRFRLLGRRISDECTECGLCRKRCRMDAISEDFKGTSSIDCILCMECKDVCPEGAISFSFIKERRTSGLDYSRRRFLTAAVCGVVGAGIIKVGFTNPVKRGRLIRPPGSMTESEFLDRCVRCGECIRVCSTSGKGLQYAGLEGGMEGFWTPILIPESGYCEYNCNMCGQVCPTGAIRPLTVEERQEIKIGTAHFDKTRCIPWYYGENCMVCEEHCPLPDKAIKFREENLKKIDGEESTVLLPYVDESLCIGCGICVFKCPLDGEKGIFLTNTNEERWIQ